jgi:pimeloyl-ACP methyl ester carboxylesterase
MAENDLIVVIPGIMGSTLKCGEDEVWTSRPLALLAALTKLGRHLHMLALPEGIGDGPPDDGVYADALMPTLHVIPHLWTPIRGYEPLVRRLHAIRSRLGNGQDRDLNPVVFPYDWRLSNRYTARRLKTVVETALQRWRDHSPDNRTAQIVFVCHSMGGLVARRYVSHEGGGALTRKVITLGTPYRGSIKALATLADTPPSMLGQFGEELHRTIHTFPSVHQLLPSYACINSPVGLEYLVDQPDSPLSTSIRRDAASFYRELEEAESADPACPARRHVIVGARQATDCTAMLQDSKYVYSQLLEHNELDGDGTVPAASIPKGIQLDDNSIRRISDKHGSLQCNAAALDELESVITSNPVVIKGASSTDLGVSAPELISSQQNLEAVVTSSSRRRVVVTLRDEEGQVIETVSSVVRNESITYTHPPLAPGGYTLAVRDVADLAPGQANTSSFLVWPQG